MSKTFKTLLIGFFCLSCGVATAQRNQANGDRPQRGPGRGGGLTGVLADQLLAQGDKNQDEKLSPAELTALATSLFKQIDTEATGKLTQEQFSAGLDKVLPAPTGAPAGRGGRGGVGRFIGGGLFTATNSNADSSLTSDEFSNAFSKWSVDWDAEKTGAISKRQLAAGLQSVFPRRGPRGGGRGGRTPTPDDNSGFTAIFNGKSLDGWDGEPGFWRVEDGVIVGETTAENPLRANTFLIWRGGKTANFELKVEYKISEVGNSGIQYRSANVPDVSKWSLKGYQADMDAANRYTGMIYEERGRGFLAPRGQFSRIASDGTTKVIGSTGEGSALGEFVKANDWNQIHIIADGQVLMQLVNGHLMSVVIDEHQQGRSSEGVLGLQLHTGPAMRIMFRNVMIKQLGVAALLSAVQQASDGGDAKSAALAAIEHLDNQRGYRWTTTEQAASRFFGGGGVGELKGQTEKGGLTQVSSSSLNFVRKSDKAAVQLEDNWMTIEQAVQRSGGGGRGRRGGMDARAVTDFQLPIDVAKDYLNKATDFKQVGDTITARLNEQEVTQVLAPPRRGRGGPPGRGGGGPQLRNPEGIVTFHLADGALAKVTVALRGSMDFRGNEVRLDRTTTTVIEGIGSTSLDVPRDAREIVDALIAGRTPKVFVPERGFKKLFNGRDLSGWAGRPEHWSVENGAIVGKTTKENPTRGNTFLIAKQGDKDSEKDLIVDDFELRLSYRITPNNNNGFANSGIQYRSQSKGDFAAAGYQADFEAGDRYSGILYDEAGGAGGRGVMAERGQSVSWTPEGQRQVTGQLGSSAEIQAAIHKDDWNEYTIIARGSRLQHFINGVPTVDVIDDVKGKRLTSGILALQLHAGEPMTVAFKDIQIKSLSAAENVAAGNVTVAKDFKLELLYMVPKESEGSWVASCLDDKGRLIVSDQNGKLYRFDLPSEGRSSRIQPEPIDLEIGGAHGLLYAFDSLYVMVNEGSLTHGLYRLLDTNGDDQFDEVKLLKEIDGSGEHGCHAIIPSPDGKSLYIVCGNQTNIFATDSSRVPLHWGEDHLLPRLETRFMAGVLAPAGFITRTDPEGKHWELIAHGFRNEFDAAFNRDGELFTFDADMEWDIGDPWYRPTRVNHVISGAEFGWRNGAGKWPDYYFDSFGAAVNVGPGSPTGVAFGYGAKFPAKYQEALFIADWSFGKLYAVHLTPEGGSYTGTLEEFVTGQPFPITDVIVNPHDGAMYVTVGGRQTQSALYRVSYVGDESTAASESDIAFKAERELRRRLESFHGHQDPQAVEAVWPYLGHQDRAIRFAARIALEWQATSTWQNRALEDADPRTAIAALAALARASSKDEFHRQPGDATPDPQLLQQVLAALDRINWGSLTKSDRVDLLRAFSLAFTRLGRPNDGIRRDLIEKLDTFFPAKSRELNHMLANLLVYLEAPSAAEKIMTLLRSAPTQEEQIDYALALRVLKTGWTMDLREEYFRWFVEKAANYRGGNTFASSLRTIKDNAIATLSDEERRALQPILDAVPETKSPQELLEQREFVKEWTMDELVPLAAAGLKGGRNFDRGRQLYGAVACASCHRFDQDGGLSGPELTGVSGRFNVRDLLESIVVPSKVVSDQYTAINIVTKDGRVISGRIGNLSGDTINVVENMLSPGEMTRVQRQDIELMEPSKVSVMPAGLLNTLKEDEIQDLIAYILSRGNSQHPSFTE